MSTTMITKVSCATASEAANYFTYNVWTPLAKLYFSAANLALLKELTKSELYNDYLVQTYDKFRDVPTYATSCAAQALPILNQDYVRIVLIEQKASACATKIYQDRLLFRNFSGVQRFWNYPTVPVTDHGARNQRGQSIETIKAQANNVYQLKTGTYALTDPKGAYHQNYVANILGVCCKK